jgi:hypothetical protein
VLRSQLKIVSTPIFFPKTTLPANNNHLNRAKLNQVAFKPRSQITEAAGEEEEDKPQAVEEVDNVPTAGEEEDIHSPCPVAEEGHRGYIPCWGQGREADPRRAVGQRTWNWRRDRVVVLVLRK